MARVRGKSSSRLQSGARRAQTARDSPRRLFKAVLDNDLETPATAGEKGLLELWQDPQERYAIFMNNFTEPAC